MFYKAHLGLSAVASFPSSGLPHASPGALGVACLKHFFISMSPLWEPTNFRFLNTSTQQAFPFCSLSLKTDTISTISSEGWAASWPQWQWWLWPPCLQCQAAPLCCWGGCSWHLGVGTALLWWSTEGPENCSETHGKAETAASQGSFPPRFLPLRRHFRNPVTFDGINKSDTTPTEFYWNVNRCLKWGCLYSVCWIQHRYSSSSTRDIELLWLSAFSCSCE